MNVNPIAFRIGSLTVNWYGILIATGVLLGAVLALREAKRQGWLEDDFLNIIIFSLLLMNER